MAVNDPTATERIADNLRRVHDRIDAACRRAGREPGEVRLVAVTKYATDDQVGALLKAGQNEIGESRLPGALGHVALLPPGGRWHLIGHLQRNKVRTTLKAAPALIHSVDSARLLEEIAKEAPAHAPDGVADLLIQVNVAREPQKEGAAPEELEALLALCRTPAIAACVRVHGLMAMAPLGDRPEDARPTFAALRKLRDAHATAEVPLLELSMGMSGDFEVAIEEGATLVRVGSALFE